MLPYSTVSNIYPISEYYLEKGSSCECFREVGNESVKKNSELWYGSVKLFRLEFIITADIGPEKLIVKFFFFFILLCCTCSMSLKTALKIFLATHSAVGYTIKKP